MLYNNEILIDIGVIDSKNGKRIASFNNNDNNAYKLAQMVTNSEAKKLMKRYSEILNIPVYNHNKDH